MRQKIFFGLIILSLAMKSMAEIDISEKESLLVSMPEDTARVNLLLKIGEYYCSRENDRALLHLQQAHTLSNKLDYSRGIALSYLWQGRVYYYKDDYALAENYLSMAMDLLDNHKDTSNLAFCFFAFGALHDVNGNYIRAIEEYQKSVRLTALTGDISLHSAALSSLGAVYTRLKEPDNALLYLREALAIRKELNDPLGVANILTCIGGSFEEKQMYDSALFYYQQGHHLRLTVKDIRPIASSEYSLGMLYIKMERFEEASMAFQNAIHYYIKLDEKAGLCMATIGLARSMNLSGKPGMAGKVALEALGIARSLNNNALISDCYETLSAIAAAGNDFQQAYQYILLHKNYSDILNQQRKEEVIKEMEARFRLERIRNEIETLKLESIAQRRNIVFLIIMIITLGILLFLVILLYRSVILAQKRQNKLHEQEVIIREQRDNLAEKETFILQEQLESEQRALAAKALEILRINETLARIISRLENLNLRQPDHSITENEIGQIVREIELHTQNNTWQEFDTIFKNIHHQFYDKLLEKCPDLTAAEIKIAALLKLNLTTKEIASITMKSEEGIKSTRYRLRKKLQLSSDEYLIPFLIQL